MVQHISVRIADVHDELKRLITHLDALPLPAEVETLEGQGRYVTLPFHEQLRMLVETASFATQEMMDELNGMDGDVRAALNDLTAHDAELAVNAHRLETILDNVEETLDASDDQSVPGSSPSDSGGAETTWGGAAS